MKPKYIYHCIPIERSSNSDPNDFNSFYMKFLYHNLFKDIFFSNQSSYLILFQNIIQKN